MPLLPFLPAILDFAGDLFGANSARSSQAAANRANLANSREQRTWEQMMSNTAVQRRVADVIAAGGNPASVFTEGRDASTPSVQAPHMEATVKPGQYAFNNTAKMVAALQASQIKATTDLTTEQANVARATAKQIEAQTGLTTTSAAESAQRTKNLEQEIEAIKARLAGQLTTNEISKLTEGTARKTQSDQIGIVAANLRRARAEATSAEKRAILDQALTDLMKFAQRKVEQFTQPKPRPGKPIQKNGPQPKIPWWKRSAE